MNRNACEEVQAVDSRDVVGDPAEHSPGLLHVCGPRGRQVGSKVLQRPAAPFLSLADKRGRCSQLACLRWVEAVPLHTHTHTHTHTHARTHARTHT